ncbi:hypothetical protein EW026_g7349, partial [Hermanssonia centrifuga]
MVVNLRLVLATLGDSARGTAAIGASEYTCMEALATVLEAGPSAQEWDRLYALSVLGVLIAVVTAAKVHQAAETEPDTMAYHLGVQFISEPFVAQRLPWKILSSCNMLNIFKTNETLQRAITSLILTINRLHLRHRIPPHLTTYTFGHAIFLCWTYHQGRRLQSQALGVLQTLISAAAPTDLQYFCNQIILTSSGSSETAFYERCCLQLNCDECVTGEPLREFFEFMLCITQFPEMRPGRMRVRYEHVSLSMCAVNACRRQLRMGDETHTWGVLNEGFRLIADMLLFDGFEQVARDSIADCELMLLLNRSAILAASTREQDISGFLLFLDTFRLAADPEFVASSKDFKRYIKRALQKIWLTTIVQLNAIPRSDPAPDVPRRDEILDQLISLGTHFGLYLQPQSI